MKNLLLFLLLLPIYIHAQIITTVAGGVTGHGGYWGDGGPATSSQLGFFGGLAVDKFGNIYIADGSNQRIRKVDAATGIINTVAGTGVAGYNGDSILATAAQLNNPGIVVVDSIGNFYIGDGNNYRIRKVDITTGIITTFAGNGTLGFSGDSGLAVVADCDFYAFTFDVFGNMIIESARDHRIRKVDIAGIITTIAGTGVAGIFGDGGLATDAKITPDGSGIGTDKFGNIYFSDSSKAVRKITISTGIITKVVGVGAYIGSPYSGDGGPATSAILTPEAVVVDDTGNLYIDDGNSRIEKVDTLGTIHSIVGTGVPGFCCDNRPADSAELNYPENVVLDKCNNIYIADFANARVRKVTYALPDTPHIAISASTSDTVCAGTPIIYHTAVSGSRGTLSYQWYVNGSMVAGTGSSYSITPVSGDSIKCVCISTSLCYGTDTVSSNTIHIVVNPVTVPTITVSAPVAAPIGSTVSVTATVTGAGSSYSIYWYDEGVLFATTTTPATSYIKTHVLDTITARVVSMAVGCYDSTTSAAWVVRDTGLSTTSPSPLQRGNVSCYPNPVVDFLTIHQSGNALIYEIVVSDVLGRVVYKGSISGSEKVIAVSSWVSGVYVLTLTPQHTPNPSQEGNVVILRVVKE